MKISEKDIYNFVFCKSKLSLETIIQIESDLECIKRVNYYKELKSVASEEDDLDGEIIKKLSLKIPAFKPEAIDLLPKDDISFMDSTSSYLARVDNKINVTDIYLFSSINDIISNYSLTFFPSGKTIKLKDNLNPASVCRQPHIDLIKLKFL